MKKYLSAKYLLLGILVLAFLLRFWNVGNQDIFGDEAADSFRAVGYIDYLGTNFQTQPIDWYKNQALPWWTHLSFHDFPPMAMIIQHGFFRVLGDSILVARLPAIILGTLAIFLIYLIAKKLFHSERIALLSALIFSINSAMVWIFRTSLLEPTLLFFLLLNIYFFLRFLEDKNQWWLFGGSLGLLALTKYTGIFLAPAYFSHLLFFKRKLFKDWQLYGALFLALILFSPVLIYNFYLYKSVGHFDLQFAYLFKQATPEWSGLVGKTQAPFSEIGKNFLNLYSLPFLALALMGFLQSIYDFYKFKNFIQSNVFLWLYLIFATLLLVKIGSANRFLSLLGPLFVILSALALDRILNWNSAVLGKILKIIAIGFLVYELIYSVNQNLIKMPDYGIAKLDHYFEKEFQGKESAVIPESDNSHLNEVIYEFNRLKPKNSERAFNLIVYNDNLALPTLEWIFYRRFFYHGIPALFVENFSKTLSLQGPNYFKGFTIYFVQSAENTLLNPFKENKTIGLNFEKSVQNLGYEPAKVIYGHDNLPMFKVYKFSI